MFGSLVTALATVVASGSLASAAAPTRTLLAVGDIGSCTSSFDEATAAIVARQPGVVALLGDIAYEHGSADEFARCFDPAWGRFKARTRPTPGNHEYNTPGATGYYDYFGARAGPRGRGYYSYNLGAWHIVSLNSNCSAAGGCKAGSPQEQWLRADLAQSRTRCALAYMHHPRFSSGLHGNDTTVLGLWQALYDAGVDVVLTGHDHMYERFMPQSPSGQLDRARGIREFIVGTGGRSLYPVESSRANSWVRNDSTYGVLRLRLAPRSYSFRFIAVAGSTFRDTGKASCH